MMYSFQYENPFNVEAEWICHLRSLDENAFLKHDDERGPYRTPREMEEEVGDFIRGLSAINDGKRLLRDGVPAEDKKAVQRWCHYRDFPYMLFFWANTQKYCLVMLSLIPLFSIALHIVRMGEAKSLRA